MLHLVDRTAGINHPAINRSFCRDIRRLNPNGAVFEFRDLPIGVQGRVCQNICRRFDIGKGRNTISSATARSARAMTTTDHAWCSGVHAHLVQHPISQAFWGGVNSLPQARPHPNAGATCHGPCVPMFQLTPCGQDHWIIRIGFIIGR